MERRVGGQGDTCILAVNARGQFGEIVETTAEHCQLLLPDGRMSFCGKGELADGTFLPVKALKVIKPDGSWIYLSQDSTNPRNNTKTRVFTRTGIYD